MDTRRSQTKYSATVPPDWGFALGVLLRVGAGDRGESRIDASSRRAIPAHSVLGSSEHDLVAGPAGLAGESEAREALAESHGPGSDLRQAAIVDPRARSSDLSISSAGHDHRSSRSMLGQRHNVHPDAPRVRLSGSHHGLVQPVRAELGSVGFIRDLILHGRAGLGVAAGTTGNLQHGPGSAVHKHSIHKPAGETRREDQHGWPRPSDGQHLHRTAVAHGEVRPHLSTRLRGCQRSDCRTEALLSVLQSRTSPSVVGKEDTRGGLLPTDRKIGHAESRLAAGSWPINDPGAIFFNRGRRFSQRKKKKQKERKQRPVETAAAVEIKQGCLRRYSLDDFHRCLKKSPQKPLRLFHSYHRPDGGGYDNNINFSKRLRSTLNKPFFGPKNGEPLIHNAPRYKTLTTGVQAD
jgi:hypothetical protein